ncbi:MAG: hypothetical protein RBT04_04180 [Sphaerochaetaceae bacterium]|nr:hypothetical protein [Sphaerochaetaceae bacterium]
MKAPYTKRVLVLLLILLVLLIIIFLNVSYCKRQLYQTDLPVLTVAVENEQQQSEVQPEKPFVPVEVEQVVQPGDAKEEEPQAVVLTVEEPIAHTQPIIPPDSDLVIQTQSVVVYDVEEPTQFDFPIGPIEEVGSAPITHIPPVVEEYIVPDTLLSSVDSDQFIPADIYEKPKAIVVESLPVPVEPAFTALIEPAGDAEPSVYEKPSDAVVEVFPDVPIVPLFSEIESPAIPVFVDLTVDPLPQPEAIAEAIYKPAIVQEPPVVILEPEIEIYAETVLEPEPIPEVIYKPAVVQEPPVVIWEPEIEIYAETVLEPEPIPEVLFAPTPVLGILAEEPLAVVEVPVEIEEEFDPWADFYVAGEEDFSIFEEGSAYYVPLLINDEYVGDIEAFFESSDISVNSEELSLYVSDRIIVEIREKLFADAPEFLPINLLIGMGIDSWYDYQRFELHMNFPPEIMPLRILSVSNVLPSRFSAYQMAGTKTLEPANFSWFANLSLYSTFDFSKNNVGDWNLEKSGLFNMQVSNSISLFDVAVDFNYFVGLRSAYSPITGWSADFNDYVNFQGWQGFYDFVDESLRLVFGNVNDYLGFSTDSFGIALEKRYAYGTVTPKRHQYNFEIDVAELSTVEIFINDRSVYKRDLQAGTYRFKDFMFSQGGNFARIVVTPFSDPTNFKEYYFTIGFDSRLMARGDSLYSYSLTFDTNNYGLSSFFSDLFAFDISSIMQNVKTNLADFSVRLYQQTGLTDAFTGTYDTSISRNGVHMGLSGILATTFGTFNADVRASMVKNLAFGFSARIDHRISFSEEAPISSVDTSFSYESKNYVSSVNATTGGSAARIAGSLSFVGKITKMLRLSVNGSLTWQFDQASPVWRITAGSGFALLPNLSVSGSISINSVIGSAPVIRGQLGANYSYSPNLGVSYSTDFSQSSFLSASYKPGGGANGAFQFSFNGIDFTDPLNHQGTVSYSLSTRQFGLTARQHYAQRFSKFSTSVSLTTAFAYADGLFGMTRSIGENFLLVTAGGELAKGDLAVTKTMSSQPSELPSLFNIGLYSAITSHIKNNIVIYGTGTSLMGSTESFVYDFTPRPRQGYSIRVSAEPTFTVVATLLRNETNAYANYTAPIAKVEYDEAGNDYLVEDEMLYLFTDENGFFFLTGLKEGVYEFDLYLPESSEEDLPVRVRFFVEAERREDDIRVFLLETFYANRIRDKLEREQQLAMIGETDPAGNILEPDGTYHLEIGRALTESEFWDDVYPKRMTRDAVTVTQETFVRTFDPEDMAIIKMRTMGDERLGQLYILSQWFKPLLERTMPTVDLRRISDSLEEDVGSSVVTMAAP